MALTRTTASAAVGLNDDVINVTSATGATVGGFIKVDGEYAVILAITGTAIAVRGRGWNGTKVAAHNVLAPVTFGLMSDIQDPGAGRSVAEDFIEEDKFSIGADGAIPVASFQKRQNMVAIKKATAAALTLASPTLAQDGIEVLFYSETAAAHTITYTPGFAGNTTSSDVATFAATIGGAIKIRAQNGVWGVISLGGVTVA